MARKKFDSSKYPIQFEYKLHLGNMKKVAEMPESFSGRTADSDRAVMLALIEWAIDKRAYTIYPGVRNISEVSGKSAATVSVAIRRLKQKGWLTISYKPGSFDYKAQRIVLNWNSKRFIEPLKSTNPKNSILDQNDIWNGNGLGSNAKIIYSTLIKNQNGKRLYELSKLTNLSVKQNTTALNKLIRAGLVKKEGRIYFDKTPKSNRAQIALVTFIRSTWHVDEKEHARLVRHENDKHRRAKTLTSPEVRKYKIEQYRNNALNSRKH